MEPDQSNPRPWADECDLIMKGGVTSGVIYPLAICELARAFRLRSIGGTSAGAIAAAAAAAAEARRQRTDIPSDDPARREDGFRLLQKLPQYLGESAPDAPTRLAGLFQPVGSLYRIFELGMAALQEGGRLSKAVRITRMLVTLSFWPWLAAIAWLIPAYTRWHAASRWLIFDSVVLAFVSALIVLVVWICRCLIVELPRNNFGICTGRSIRPAGEKNARALTDWLTDYLDELSGQKLATSARPLTFGDLRKCEIDLQMMTTCLTLGRPYRLPFRDDELVKENRSFLWRREDFELLFPERIVKWMEQHQWATPQMGERLAVPGYLRLPDPDDLPVVVAVRMSLSFPVLLSAVGLYACDYRVPASLRGPERIWFTDGGVASNFPIHFFDSPVPARPTFGIDLGHASQFTPSGVYLPDRNSDAVLSDWRRLPLGGSKQLFAFLAATLDVGTAWDHESLSHLPGYRDRIALVRLNDDEGGLNLNMPLERIQRLSAFGWEAGRRFVRRFGNPALWTPEVATSETSDPELDWTNHQIIRLRSLLTTTAEHVTALEQVCSKLRRTPSAYERFLEPGAPASSYRLEDLGTCSGTGQPPRTQASLARAVLRRLQELAQLLERSESAAAAEGKDIRPVKRTPRPPPELKVRPRI